MKYTFILSLVYFFHILYGYGQVETVDVAELTLKVGGMETEEVYYGFAEGDRIIFNFEEVKGKPLRGIEITELQANSKFMDYKSTSIVDKEILVNRKTIYKFSFRNSALSGRVCRIKIQRIPKSIDLIPFNTNWEWETRHDTTYVPFAQDSLVGYDTLRYKEMVKELVSIRKVDEMIIDKNQRVHSYLNQNSSSTYLRVDLPSSRNEPYKEEKVIAWAYWIGVGEEASQAYAKNIAALGELASGVASVYGSPLAGVAVGTFTELLAPKTGEDVQYAFIPNFENVQAYINKQKYYQFDSGKGIAAYGKNSDRLNGTFYIGLYNDNQTLGIDVNVKIVVIKEIKTFEDNQYNRQKITPRYVTLHKKKMIVDTLKIRVNAR